MKELKVAVRDFAVPSPRRGSIEALSGFGRAQELGREIHDRVQARRAKRFPDYRAEVRLERAFEAGGYRFLVGGKVDGLFDGAVPKLEEIKTAFNAEELLRRLDEDPEHPYCLQLRTYGYLHRLAHDAEPELSLHLVSTRSFETLDLPIRLDRPGYEAWLARRLRELAEEAELAERRAARRRKAAQALAFPFERPRPGQLELGRAVEGAMAEERPLLLQAPTGLGKTVGVLYPALKEALGRGQRVVYVTPKNSQHGVAEDAVRRLHEGVKEGGGNIRSMTVTAKAKLCLKNEPLCNPDYCEYARDHYTKVAAHGLVRALAKKRKLSARVFTRVAREHQVCPYELQVDAALDADAVICDYNYVFAPRSALGTLTALGLDQEGGPNLVVDEAHNLPARALDYYSPELSTAALEGLRDGLSRLEGRLRERALALLDECIDTVAGCAPGDAEGPCRISPPARTFLEVEARLRAFLAEYLASDVEIPPRDPVLRLSFYWSEFATALGWIAEGHEAFFTTYRPSPPAVRITCCDASGMLAQRYDGYAHVVGFSATLKPFDFYRRLMGLPEDGTSTAEFVSPFPAERRKLLVIPQLSSRYSRRARTYPKVAEAIGRIAGLKPGNYFAFFPSFEFMERVLERTQAPPGFALLRQTRRMTRDAVEELFERLQAPGGAHLVFAVQGGMLAEGVDYPGEMAIGAFVVGPGLPTFDLEREHMREYYEKRYGAGFDYAYAYPAMAKAVQAAGRVIRSETDRGLIVLMDDRFLSPAFAKSMPRDWFAQSPRELVSERILADVQRFWAETTPGPFGHPWPRPSDPGCRRPSGTS
ncbi:MAG: ATP-dependent DNA helicase [Elusimicrobia bacterium]|nr:ATP-dependent DNA helicase [Elusimicrobiota bacterium]